MFEEEPALKDDPRFKLYPEWMQQQAAQMANLAAPNLGVDPTGNGKMVMDVMHAGAVIVAGTDTPNAINLHGELAAYVDGRHDPVSKR